MTVSYLLFTSLLCAIIGYICCAEYMETKAHFLKTCKIKDRGYEACSTESTQRLYNELPKGIQGLKDLDFDPMRLNKVSILGDDGPVSINTTLTKVVVTGFSSIEVVESYVTPKDYSGINKLYIPKIRIEGNYRMQGRILVLPLNGQGSCWFEPTGMALTVYTKNHLYEKFGHIFYNITGVKVDYEISGLKLRLNNIFAGAKALEESTNQYLNENWRSVADALKPLIAKAIEENFYRILNKLFSFMPADYLISDISHPSELYAALIEKKNLEENQ